jgi:hypothetical protein
MLFLFLFIVFMLAEGAEGIDRMVASFWQEREWKAERRWREAQKKGGRS